MTDALTQFSVELWSVDAEAAKMFDAMVRQFTVAGYFNKSVRNLLKAIEWIAGRNDKSIMDRLTQMQRLGEIKPPFVGSLRKFTGWDC
jgi:hypothetical protein